MLFNCNDGVGQDKVNEIVASLDQLLKSPNVKSAQIVPLAQSAVPERLKAKATYLNSLLVGFDNLEAAIAFNDDPIHTEWGNVHFKPYRQDNSLFFVYDTKSSV